MTSSNKPTRPELRGQPIPEATAHAPSTVEANWTERGEEGVLQIRLAGRTWSARDFLAVSCHAATEKMRSRIQHALVASAGSFML